MGKSKARNGSLVFNVQQMLVARFDNKPLFPNHILNAQHLSDLFDILLMLVDLLIYHQLLCSDWFFIG